MAGRKRVRARAGPATKRYTRTVARMKKTYGLSYSTKWGRLSPITKAREVIKFRKIMGR